MRKLYENRHDGMRMVALCVAAAVAVAANAEDAGELFEGSQRIEQPKVLSAAAKFGGNEIRLYLQPLRYEVLKDGVVVVPPARCSLRSSRSIRKRRNSPSAVRVDSRIP